MDYSTLSLEKLIVACTGAGETAAWEEFVSRFHRLIATIALRIGRRHGDSSPQLIEDLVQDTYLKLCEDDFRLLRRFQSRHDDAMYGYIKVVTSNLAHDHFKAIRSQKRGGAVESISSDSIDTAAEGTGVPKSTESAERNIFIREVDACLRSMGSQNKSERDRRIFWLYYRIGLPATAIAALPSIGLTTKGVESTLLRLTKHVRDHLTAKPVSGPASNAKEVEGVEPAESL